MKRTLLLLAVLFLVSKATLAQVPSYVPSNGLVGWWPFNGNANDESGNGNNGTTMNGVALTTDRNGNANSAYNFDGVDDWIYVANSNSLNPNKMTLSAWVNTNAYNNSNASMIINKGWDQGPGHYDLLLFTPTQKSRFVIGSNLYVESNSFINLNTWNLVTATIDSNVTKIYINGILENSVTQSSVNSLGSSTDPLYFGKHDYNNYPYYFNGIIDDIGIWNRALDSCEVKDLYYASLGNCCQASFSSQPQNQNANTGTSASFIAQSSSANPIFQWQSNTGSGWQNLSNAGQYSGVNNDTLVVTNLSAANNNQLFRCILMSGTCSDTSATATLSVSQTNGLTTLQSEVISIYPNPATNQITILSNAARYPLSYKVYNEVGQTILVGELKSNTTSLDISNLATGNYVLLVGTKHVSFVKNKI